MIEAQFPFEILVQIIGKLDARSIVRLQQVSAQAGVMVQVGEAHSLQRAPSTSTKSLKAQAR